ncbi:hypothetical protein X777_08097 [Ooceraea biroi]|uniref:Uncharacterized protein n=1 Tax=Ooceraea biroi TaxID=2015173 RepID=A0A026WC56_OOCBI|nr:hypothetical protein X777_08097 [Ooceraea biroi]
MRGLWETDRYYPCCFNEMTMDDGSSMITASAKDYSYRCAAYICMKWEASLSTLKFRVVGPYCVRCAEQQYTK